MPVLLDPTDERKPVTRDRTPRPGNLSGVVGLLDISKARGDVFLAHLAHEATAGAPRYRGAYLPEADVREAGAGGSPPANRGRVRVRDRSPRGLRLLHDVQCARHGPLRISRNSLGLRRVERLRRSGRRPGRSPGSSRRRTRLRAPSYPGRERRRARRARGSCPAPDRRVTRGRLSRQLHRRFVAQPNGNSSPRACLGK